MDFWVWKTEIASNRSRTPGTGMRLVSVSQECSSWLQGVGKLQGDYQSFLICAWADKYPNLRCALNLTALFESTCICESAISRMNITKTHLKLGYLSATCTFPQHYMLSRLSRCWFGSDLNVILQCQNLTPRQGLNEVRRRPGQASRLAPHIRIWGLSEEMYCIEESICDIVGTFRCPHSDLAPRELCPPFPPRYAPALKSGVFQVEKWLDFHGNVANTT